MTKLCKYLDSQCCITCIHQYTTIIYVKMFLYLVQIITWHLFASKLTTENDFVQKGAKCKIPYLVMKTHPYKLQFCKTNRVSV